MNLKDYREQPEAGLFEKIEKRLRMRRMARVGGVVAAVCVVAAVVIAVMLNLRSTEDGEMVVAQVVDMPQIVAEEAQNTAALQTELGDGEEASMDRRNDLQLINNPKEKDAAQRTATLQTVQEGREVASNQMKLMNNAELQKAVPQQSEQKMATPATRETKPVASKPAAQSVAENAAKEIVQPVVSHSNTAAVAETEEPETDTPQSDKSGITSAEQFGTLVWAPNVIAPDADVDENRNFKLKFNASVTDFHIYIYNRGGRQLYTSMDPDFEWDGTCNGTKMPQGAYVWVAKFRDSSNRPHQEKGTVTIVR